MSGDDGSGNDLPRDVQHEILAILDRHADETRRELRALFLRLEPRHANALVRRLAPGNDDQLARMFRRVVEPRRLVR